MNISENPDILQTNLGRIISIKYSPDGDFLVFAGERNIFLYKTKDYSIYKSILLENPITGITFNDNGEELISTDNNKKTIIMTFPEMKIKKEMIEDFTVSAIISINSFIISGSNEGTLEIKDKYKTVWKEIAHKGTINTIASGNNGFIASGGADGLIKLWKSYDKENIKEITTLKGHDEEVLSLLFINNGTCLISGGDDGLLNFWSIPDGKLLKTIKKKNGITDIQSDRKEEKLYIASSPRYYGQFSDDTIEIYNTQKEIWEGILKEIFEGLVSISLHPDEEQLAAGGFNGTVKIWHKKDLQFSIYGEIKRHRGEINFIKFWNDKNIIISGGSDSSVLFWDYSSKNIVKKIEGLTNGVRAIDCSPSHRYLAFSPKGKFNFTSSENYIKIWDLEKNTEICTLPGHSDEVRALKFNKKETFLASGGKDRIIKLWSLTERNKSFIPGYEEKSIEALAFDKTDRILASGGTDRNIYLWDMEEKKLAGKLSGHEGAITCLTFSLKKNILFSGSYDSQLKIWSIDNGNNIENLKLEWSLKEIVLNEDETIIALITNNGTIQFWKTDEMKHITTLRFNGHCEQILTVRFINNNTAEIGEGHNSIIGIRKIELL